MECLGRLSRRVPRSSLWDATQSLNGGATVRLRFPATGNGAEMARKNVLPWGQPENRLETVLMAARATTEGRV